MVSDTTPRTREILTGLLRKAGPEACLRLALQMSEDYRAIAESGIRSRRPGVTDAEVRHELARMYLGPALADRVHARNPA